MKKFLMILVIILCAGVAVGMIGSFIFIAGGGVRGEEMELKTNTQNYASGEKLSVECTTSDIVVAVGKANEITFDYTESNYRTVTISHENGVISFKETNTLSGFLFWWIGKKTTVKVTVPENFDGDIKIVGTTGKADIALPEIAVRDFTARMTTGKVTVERVNASGEGRVEITTGGMSVVQSSFGKNLKLNTTTGLLQAENVTVGGDLSAESTTGKITIKDVVVSGKLNGKSTTGSSTYNATCGEARFNSTTGSIRFAVKGAEKIKATCTTGDIIGTVYGNEKDYSVDYRTVTGKSNLPRRAEGSKSFYASTTTGDIDVHFEN